jgi:hypothetical protein
MILIPALNGRFVPRGSAAFWAFVPLSRRGEGPEAEDKRQRVVPPLAAGVLEAGLVVDAGIIVASLGLDAT